LALKGRVRTISDIARIEACAGPTVGGWDDGIALGVVALVGIFVIVGVAPVGTMEGDKEGKKSLGIVLGSRLGESLGIVDSEADMENRLKSFLEAHSVLKLTVPVKGLMMEVE
jgi:hypothetical protein